MHASSGLDVTSSSHHTSSPVSNMQVEAAAHANPGLATSDDAKLYCICRSRYDESRPMIACDVCNTWYHFSCLGMDETVADQLQTYVCQNCQRKQGTTAAKRARKRPRKSLSSHQSSKAMLPAASIADIESTQPEPEPEPEPEEVDDDSDSDYERNVPSERPSSKRSAASSSTTPPSPRRRPRAGATMQPAEYPLHSVQVMLQSLSKYNATNLAPQQPPPSTASAAASTPHVPVSASSTPLPAPSVIRHVQQSLASKQPDSAVAARLTASLQHSADPYYELKQRLKQLRRVNHRLFDAVVVDIEWDQVIDLHHTEQQHEQLSDNTADPALELLDDSKPGLTAPGMIAGNMLEVAVDRIPSDAPAGADALSQEAADALSSNSSLTKLQLYQMPVHLLQTDGYLFLWTLNNDSCYTFACELMEHWGWTFTDEISWADMSSVDAGHGKQDATSKLLQPNVDTAAYQPFVHYQLLIGRRGDEPASLVSYTADQVVMARATRGKPATQAKPSAIHRMIEQMMPDGTYLQVGDSPLHRKTWNHFELSLLLPPQPHNQAEVT